MGAAAASGVSDPARRGAAIAPLASGQALLATGPIGPGFAPRLRELLDAYPESNVLIVRGPGGMRHQALEAAELVNERGLTVRVAGRCASACALLWAAAKSREMTPGSRLGLHASRLTLPVPLPGLLTRRIVARNDRQTDAVLRRAGFPAHIIAEGGRTPPTSMSWFDPLELQHGGVPFTLRDEPAAGIVASGATHAAADAARH